MEKRRYDHLHIEKKWQRIWEDRELFKVSVDPSRPKYYILDMFPYPSGAGLHVGHVTGYTATDILARYKRQKGFNVLHPMGWDSFGLPAEQYAIRTGTHPSVTTEENIKTYRRQLKALGFSYDWSREVATSDPKYYKWTQWIFTKLYEKGLAYEAEVLVNFCPALGTVLANEEVEEGRSKEGGYLIERKPLRQWMLKITDYAQRLLEDLDLVDWPDSIKKLQINWIGKSEGIKIHFIEQASGSRISVFTTCPHTLFGVSYLVLAPEHPLMDLIVTEEQKEAVQRYCNSVNSKSDLERTDLSKEKSGVWTGAVALNPVSGHFVPIWVGDYVLQQYGTGAVMGVPSHDERDFAFALHYNLPLRPVIDPDVNATTNDPDLRAAVLEGNRCWTGEGTLIHSESSTLSLNGLSCAEAQQVVMAFLESQGSGERMVNYKLRDWLFSRQRYWGEPFPILHCADGSKRILSVDELPLCPPELSDFKPSTSGESPLAKASHWVQIIDPKTGQRVLRETNTMPQWAGSCWYYLRFCSPHSEDVAWDRKEESYWMPVDLYVGGVEHAVLHLLYARFWHKVLYDLDLVSTKEPFYRLRNQGLVVARSYQLPGGGYLSPDEVQEKQGQFIQIGTGEVLKSQIDKMSKSKLNGVAPDVMIEDWGADALRLYEMFMGPFDREKVWNSDAVSGCKRFLNRFYDLVFSDKVTDQETDIANRLSHRMVHGVEKDIEAMQYNTAIAKMMEFINAFAPLELYPKSALRRCAQVLYPFAPHLAEEVWELLGGTESLTYEPFPAWDPQYLVDETATYVVQVNGKLRAKWTLPQDMTQEELLSLAREDALVRKFLIGEIVKVVYVTNKLLSIVCHV